MSEEQKTPSSGLELAEMLGVGRDEGVVIAVLPSVIEEVTTQELPYLDKKNEHCHVVLANMGPWGERAMDVISPNDEDIRWWRAKEAIAIAGKNLLPVRWEGAIGDIPQTYFDNGYVLGVRFYRHGPWFFPKEMPQVRTDEALLNVAEGAGEVDAG